jgi:hypothetical protein
MTIVRKLTAWRLKTLRKFNKPLRIEEVNIHTLTVLTYSIGIGTKDSNSGNRFE